MLQHETVRRARPLTLTLVTLHLALGSRSRETWGHVYGDGWNPLEWLSSVFPHASPEHLIGSLLWLALCAGFLEPFLGWRRLALLYFGLAGSQGFLEEGIATWTTSLGTGSFGASGLTHGLLGFALLVPGPAHTAYLWAQRVRCLFVMLYGVELAALVVGVAPLSRSSELTHVLGFGLGLLFGSVARGRRARDESRIKLS